MKKIVSAFLFAISFLSSASVAGQRPATVRIAISDTDLASEPLYAQQTGIFARAGLDVRLSPSRHGGAGVIAELEAGTIDVGFSNLISIAAAVQRGDPVVLLAPAGIHNRNEPVNAIVGAPDSTYRTGADLNGKTISSPSGPGSAGALAPAAWIDATGGDSRTVRFITGIEPFDVPSALREHRIDAAEMGDPDLTILRQRGEIKVIASPFDAIGDGYLLAGFVASKAWVQANPDAARRTLGEHPSLRDGGDPCQSPASLPGGRTRDVADDVRRNANAGDHATPARRRRALWDHQADERERAHPRRRQAVK